MSDFPPPPPPIQPRPSLRSMRATESSSSASSHALDFSLDHHQNAGDNPVAATPNNIADELAHLNIVPIKPAAIYADYDDQKVFKKADEGKLDDRKWSRVIYTIVRGRAMPLKPLLLAFLWSVTAVTISYFTSRHYAPHLRNECRWWCTPLAIDGNALSYVGFALFLLTSFRVQEAYGRYMEAVRVWTSLGGTISSFAKYVLQAFPEGMFHRGDRERILGFLVAFPVALKRELRGERDLRELKNVLTEEDLAKLQNAESMSSFCLYVLSGYVLNAKAEEAKLPQTFIVHLIRWIADLAGAADVCMQIKTMPAPYSYITHLNTFLALWLFFLPFAVVETTGWATILIVSFISYGILGVVANAAELEDPFGSDYNDLPLGRLAQAVQDSVAATYHASLADKELFVREVSDAALKKRHDYWLKPQREE